jgi:hypothetical protein
MNTPPAARDLPTDKLTYTTDKPKQVKGIQGGIEYKKFGGLGSMLSSKIPGWYIGNDRITRPGSGSWGYIHDGYVITMYWMGPADPINKLSITENDLAFLNKKVPMTAANFMELNTATPSKPVWISAKLSEAAQETLNIYNGQVKANKNAAEKAAAKAEEAASKKRNNDYKIFRREQAEKYESSAKKLEQNAMATGLLPQAKANLSAKAQSAAYEAYKAWSSVGKNELEQYKQRRQIASKSPSESPSPPSPPIAVQGGRRKSKRFKRSKRSKKTKRHSRK